MDGWDGGDKDRDDNGVDGRRLNCCCKKKVHAGMPLYSLGMTPCGARAFGRVGFSVTMRIPIHVLVCLRRTRRTKFKGERKSRENKQLHKQIPKMFTIWKRIQFEDCLFTVSDLSGENSPLCRYHHHLIHHDRSAMSFLVRNLNLMGL